MLSIIPGKNVSELDKAFISYEGISSLELMERAAVSFCDWFFAHFPKNKNSIYIFCGPGNNGGDGLAIGRLLSKKTENIQIVYFKDSKDCSDDYQSNFSRLPKNIHKIQINDFGFNISKDDVIIDGIFGVGINRPLEGIFKESIDKLNRLEGKKISIDIPSGIPSDAVLVGTCFKAEYTVTFQFPKLSLLFPEHATFVGDIHIADIGIPDEFLKSFCDQKFFIRKSDIVGLHKKFHNFSHKGDYGRVIIIGGSVGKVGAVLMASKSALRTGSGLVHAHIPKEERMVLQIAVPEVMIFDSLEVQEFDQFDAIGIGPGWGMNIDISFYKKLLSNYNRPVVIDADGINLISKNPDLLKLIPKNSILTPHIKEFERLVGICKNQKERLRKAQDLAKDYNIFIVLKGAFTCISCPDGNQYFNSTGNKYMATAGSGDVLTGMITSFLGQGYKPFNAAVCGVFHHGLAGELASEYKRRGLIASDIIDSIPLTYIQMDTD
jgi:NAD(P)H-hydrate epimerase